MFLFLVNLRGEFVVGPGTVISNVPMISNVVVDVVVVVAVAVVVVMAVAVVVVVVVVVACQRGVLHAKAGMVEGFCSCGAKCSLRN